MLLIFYESNIPNLCLVMQSINTVLLYKLQLVFYAKLWSLLQYQNRLQIYTITILAFGVIFVNGGLRWAEIIPRNLHTQFNDFTVGFLFSWLPVFSKLVCRYFKKVILLAVVNEFTININDIS